MIDIVCFFPKQGILAQSPLYNLETCPYQYLMCKGFLFYLLCCLQQCSGPDSHKLITTVTVVRRFYLLHMLSGSCLGNHCFQAQEFVPVFPSKIMLFAFIFRYLTWVVCVCACVCVIWVKNPKSSLFLWILSGSNPFYWNASLFPIEWDWYTWLEIIGLWSTCFWILFINFTCVLMPAPHCKILNQEVVSPLSLFFTFSTACLI